MTKVQALLKLIKNNGGKADWKTIYQTIGKYYPELKRSKGMPLTEIDKAGIRGVLYRDCDKGRRIFTKVADGVFALQ